MLHVKYRLNLSKLLLKRCHTLRTKAGFGLLFTTNANETLQSARPGPQIDAVSTKVQTNHSNPIFSLHSWHNMPTPVAAPESESRLKKFLQRNEAIVTTYRVICNEFNFEYSIHIAHHYLIPSYTHDIQWLSRRQNTSLHHCSTKVTSPNFETNFFRYPLIVEIQKAAGGASWLFGVNDKNSTKLHSSSDWTSSLGWKKGVEWVVWIRSSGVFQDVSEGPQIRRTECAKHRFNIQRFIPMHSVVTRGDFRPNKCSMVSVTFMNG